MAAVTAFANPVERDTPAPPPPDTAKASHDSAMFRWHLRGNAFVLTSIGPVSPFYHGSGLVHVFSTLELGRYAALVVHAAGESWNHSLQYGERRNLIVWAKPAIRGMLPIDAAPLDSVTVLAGDLWRVRHAKGLVLDYYEAQGAEGSLWAGKFNLMIRTMGVGWDYYDDIKTIAVRYDTSFGIHLFNDHHSSFYSLTRENNDALILSCDGAVDITPGIRLYGEVGTNLLNDGVGALIGARASYNDGDTRLTVESEYRLYDALFFGDRRSDSMPYFESLTALDKPINHFDTYRRDGRDHSVFSVHVTGRRTLIGRLFLDLDAEFLLGTISESAVQAFFGFDTGYNTSLQIGMYNKYFNLYNPDEYSVTTEPPTAMFRTGNFRVQLRALARF